MSNDRTPVEERRGIQLTALHPRDLVEGIWNGERDFSFRVLEYPESVGSYVDSGTGTINQYVDQNEEDLARRPIGFQSSILANLYAPGIKLPFTNFTLSDLSDADLSRADLRRAIFAGANLGKVDFTLSDLTCADLRDASGLETAYFQEANYDGAIILPKQVELVKRIGLDVGRLDVRGYR